MGKNHQRLCEIPSYLFVGGVELAELRSSHAHQQNTAALSKYRANQFNEGKEFAKSYRELNQLAIQLASILPSESQPLKNSISLERRRLLRSSVTNSVGL